MNNGEPPYVTDSCGPKVREKRVFPVSGASGHPGPGHRPRGVIQNPCCSMACTLRASTLTLCDAIELLGRKSGFRAGFLPDSSRESFKNGPSGRPKAGEPESPLNNGSSRPQNSLFMGFPRQRSL